MHGLVLIIHLIICAGLIGLVLMQRSEGGALGVGGGGGALMSGRGAADALARFTSIAGGLFLVTSVVLTILASAERGNADRSIFDRLAPARPAIETPAPAPETGPDARAASEMDFAAPVPTPAATGVTIAPPPAAASERAAPVIPSADLRPTTSAAVTPPPATRPAATTTRTATQTPTQRPTTTAAQRPTTTAAQRSTATPAPRRTSAPPAESTPVAESGEAQTPPAPPVRQRAGPDQ